MFITHTAPSEAKRRRAVTLDLKLLTLVNQLALAEETAVHQLHHQIGFLRVAHRHLSDAFRVPVVQQDPPDRAALAALLAQIVLVLEQQVHLAIEQLRLEEVLDDDDPLVLGAFAAHLFRAPVEQPAKRHRPYVREF
uniref:Uncharacterized protein n=1 Tax=Anopheles farauti TaxID=69004 RepID=A0A182QMI7_9DIPT